MTSLPSQQPTQCPMCGGHEQSFLDEIRTFHLTPEFQSPDDLRAQIEDRLMTIAAEDLAPWCKLGNIVFRATEVVDRGNELFVTARIRADEVAHALEEFRGNRHSRGREARFTWAGRSRYTRVQNVESTTRSARSREMRLNFEVIEPPQDYRLEMSVGNLGPADLTEAAIRTALFGEPNPLGDKYVGFVAEIPEPLKPLRDARVSDEIARPLAELLIVDALVGSGRAARVAGFNLGTAIREVRHLKLSWESTGRYAGERGDVKTIAGTVRL